MDKHSDSNCRYFRAGVGTVIYNSKGEVAMFERAKHPVGVWQFQQGGIDLDEDTETTLWRELQEEVGLEKSDIEAVQEMSEWTIYPTEDSLKDNSKSRIGQAHKWYFLKLKTTSTIDLSQATDDEASDFRFTSFDDAIKVTEELKQPVYKTLKQYFYEQVLD